MKYDTIIIGAGLSGLAAGIRLAYFDQRVCILERHTTIGGLNSFYRLRGRNHDVGLHAVTNYAEPGTRTGPLSKLLRQLRLRWDDFDLKPQIESSIEFGNCVLRFTNEFSFLLDQIRERFPRQIDGFRKLLAVIDQHDELHLTAETHSAREILKQNLSDPLLIDMLLCPLMFYGSPTPRDMDFSQFVIMFKSIFYQGFGRPYAGVRHMLKQVVRKFKELGGELRLRSGVQSIQNERGHATAVVLDDGTVLEADRILSSAGLAETRNLYHAPPDPEGLCRPGEISFVESIFSLDCQPSELGHHETIVFYNDSETFHYENPEAPVDLRSGIVCSPNNFQYDTPLDEGRIRITALANPRHWMSLAQADYEREKSSWCARMVESALRYIPDFRGHIADTDLFTPRTIRKFTGHLNGCVYGAPHKVRDGRTELDNVFLCGTDQGFLGIVGSMLSGITIANLHCLKTTAATPVANLGRGVPD